MPGSCTVDLYNLCHTCNGTLPTVEQASVCDIMQVESGDVACPASERQLWEP
jgi:hypothetical protein